MGEVIGIDGRLRDPLIEGIRAQLETEGTAQAREADLEVPVPAWRAAVRAAAKELARPVQTVAGGGEVWAALRDWPANERELEIHRARLRAALTGITLGKERGGLRAVED